MLSLIYCMLFDKCPLKYLWRFDHKGRIFSSGRRLDFDLSFGFNFRWAFVESLDVHLKVHHRLMAQVAEGAVFQMQSIFVSFHISFSRKDFVTNITRELAALALVYLWYVDPEVFLVAKVFVAHAAHVLLPRSLGFILLGPRHRQWTRGGGWQQQLGNLHGWPRHPAGQRSPGSLGRLRHNVGQRLGRAHNNLGRQRVVVDCCCD